MRGLIVAILAAFCGSLGALLWERVMKDAPDWLWRLMALAFWVGIGGIIALTDPLNLEVKLHPKAALSISLAWLFVGALFAASKRFRSARLEMKFVKTRSPYEDHEVLEINGEICNATLYRISIDADKTASVSVTVDGVSLEHSERHDVPLHRMGDQTNVETVTEVSKGRRRYWDLLLYVKSPRLLVLKHIQGNLPSLLYPTNQSFTIIATAPGTREINRVAKVEINEDDDLLFTLADAKETRRLRSSQ